MGGRQGATGADKGADKGYAVPARRFESRATRAAGHHGARGSMEHAAAWSTRQHGARKRSAMPMQPRARAHEVAPVCIVMRHGDDGLCPRRQWLRRGRALAPARRASGARGRRHRVPVATPVACSATCTPSSSRWPTGRCSTAPPRSGREPMSSSWPFRTVSRRHSSARSPATRSSSTSGPTTASPTPADWTRVLRRRACRHLALRPARAARRARRTAPTPGGSPTPVATRPRSRSHWRRFWPPGSPTPRTWSSSRPAAPAGRAGAPSAT